MTSVCECVCEGSVFVESVCRCEGNVYEGRCICEGSVRKGVYVKVVCVRECV